MGNIVRKEVFVLFAIIARVVNCDADHLCFGEIFFEHGFGVSAEGNVPAVVAYVSKGCVSVIDSEFFKGFYKCGRVGFLFFEKNIVYTDHRTEIFEHVVVLKGSFDDSGAVLGTDAHFCFFKML
mgnify:CR=1 FL=1